MSSSRTRRSPRVRPMGRTELNCQFCDRAFFKTDHLSRHERSHTKEKPFYCGSCDKYFSRQLINPLPQLLAVPRLTSHSDTLLRHMNKLHDAVNAEPPNQDISSKMLTGSPVVSAICDREVESSVNAAQFSTTTNRARLIADDETHEVAGQTVALELGDAELSPSIITFPDQSAWWLDYGFDPNFLDIPLFEPTASPERFQHDATGKNASDKAQCDRSFPENNIQKAWFTYVGDSRILDVSQETALDRSRPSASTENNYDLDEDFRTRVSKRLTTHLNLDPLPSTGLLNLSMELYFREFAPLFPIIHRHTFKHSVDNSLVLLLMCSIGSLLAGEVANHHGVKIFERFSGNIMALWDATLNHCNAIPLIQASVLSQVFGLLSGIPKHILIVDSFHGTIISWARRCNMFVQNNQLPNLENVEGSNLEETWKTWVRSEELVRTVISLYILDVQIATIFHHDPLLRHDSIASYIAADDDVFNAPTSWDWKVAILRKAEIRQLPSPRLVYSSQFTSYLALQRISAAICQEQPRDKLEVSSVKFKQHSDDLMNWRRRFDEESASQNDNAPSDALGLVILWHATFMGLIADFNKLERALGRDGHHSLHFESDIAYAVSWSMSVAAERCVLHAYAIQQRLSQMRLDSEPAIHVPHCAFLAGIASYSCLRFRRPDMLSRYPPCHRMILPRSLSDFPEFNINGEAELGGHLLGSNSSQVLFENERGVLVMHTITPPHRVVQIGADILRRCHDVLEKMGHFDATRSYAKVLKALVQIEIEKWMRGS